MTLFEREEELGGQARLAAHLPHATEFANVYEYREHALARLGVDVRLGASVGADDVGALEPDAVILATGSRPSSSVFQLSLGGSASIHPGSSDLVHSVVDVLRAGELDSGSVLLVDGDGHRKALGTAELLASRGHDVTIVSEDMVIGGELAAAGALVPLMQRLAALKVRLMPWTALVAFDRGCGRVRSLYDSSETMLEVDSLVVATQHESEDELRVPLEKAGLLVKVIGDARSPRLMDSAISDGLEAGAWLFDDYSPEEMRTA